MTAVEIRPWDCPWHHPGDEECFDADGRTASELEELWRADGPLTDDAAASAEHWEQVWAGTAAEGGS